MPLKKRRQMEEQERLARLGRAPQPTSSADTGGRSGGTDSEAEVDHRHKESLLVMKAKQLQEVRAALSGCLMGSPACFEGLSLF